MVKAQRGYWLVALVAALFIMGLVAMPVQAAQYPTVTGIKVTSMAGSVKVHVVADGPVSYRSKLVREPSAMLVVDVYPAVLGKGAMKVFDVNTGMVAKVRTTQASDGVVKVLVELVSPAQYTVASATGGKGVVMVVGMEPYTAEAPKAGKPAPAPVASAPAPAVRPTPKPAPRPVVTAPARPTVVAPTAHAARPAPAPRPRPRVKPDPMKKLVTLDFVNADLIQVLKLLAKQSGLNIAADPQVQGSVTISLKNVPLGTALNLILKLQGYEYKKVADNILVVGTAASLANITQASISPIEPGKKLTQVIVLEQAQASDVQSNVTALYPDLQVQVDTRLNALIVTSDLDTIKKVKEFVAQLDQPRIPPPPPETEVIKMRYATAKDAVTQIKTVLGEVADIQVDERLNALIVTGSPEGVDQIKEFLAKVDIPLQQVMLDLKVVDITSTGRKSLGINWNQWLATTIFAEGARPDGTAPPAYLGIPIDAFARTPFSLTATLNFLVESNEARILAAPRIATMSGKTASIHVGDKFPIVYYDPRAGQYQVIYVDIGIKLEVKPTIGPDGYITCDITPTVSSLRELIQNQYPRTIERTATTTMRVKDGETIVIGGLIQDEDREVVDKVPLLGDLPIVGALFKTTTKGPDVKSEVVIMITPKVLSH